MSETIFYELSVNFEHVTKQTRQYFVPKVEKSQLIDDKPKTVISHMYLHWLFVRLKPLT